MNFLQNLRNEKVCLFVGGVAATLAGLYVVKSGKAKKLAVKSVAAGMQIQSKAYETFQNIKEEAMDIVHDANALENEAFQEKCEEDAANE